MTQFVFDAHGLGNIIAFSCRRVLESHGLELTDADQEVAGQAAADFLSAVQNHQAEQRRLVDSVSRDLDELPVIETSDPSRYLDARRLGIEPPV